LVAILSPIIALIIDVTVIALSVNGGFDVHRQFPVSYRIVFDLQVLMGIYGAVQVAIRPQAIGDFWVRFCLGCSITAAIGFNFLLIIDSGFGFVFLIAATNLVGVSILALIAIAATVIPGWKLKYRLLDFIWIVSLLSVLMWIASQLSLKETLVPIVADFGLLLSSTSYFATPLYYFFCFTAGIGRTAYCKLRLNFRRKIRRYRGFIVLGSCCGFCLL